MTMGELVEKVGLERLRKEGKLTYDFAYPNRWALEVERITGRYPYGLVWLYDPGILGEKCTTFGRPYPLTLYAYQLIRTYEIGRELEHRYGAKVYEDGKLNPKYRIGG